MPIYLEIEGIEGNITAKGYEKIIEVSSFNWDVGSAISQNAGRRLTVKPLAQALAKSHSPKWLIKQRHCLFKNLQ
jgi:type VI secretion system secreted protein Hcp